MKALSIRHPWAWLIVHGFKDVENRSWATKVRGQILVHAGKAFDKEGYGWVRREFPQIPLPTPSEFEFGGIVGCADLVDCVPPDSDITGRIASPWYFGQHGFLLANARPLPFVAITGRLGFFEVANTVMEKS